MRWSKSLMLPSMLVVVALSACANTKSEPDGVRAPLRTPLGTSSCAGESTAAREAREAIARVRSMAGLPALGCSVEASRAAKRHCAYLERNKVMSHVEVVGKPLFFGVSVDDRLAAERFPLQTAGEVIASLEGGAAIDDEGGLINSVYHRVLFLRSETTAFGYGDANGCSTIDFGRPTNSGAVPQMVVWPPNGATNVPPVFVAANETPNPVPGMTSVGPPITVVLGAPLAGIVARLDGPSGAVPVRVLSASTDPAKLVRANEAHVIPLKPLAGGTRYTARIVMQTPAITIVSTFTTAES